MGRGVVVCVVLAGCSSYGSDATTKPVTNATPPPAVDAGSDSASPPPVEVVEAGVAPACDLDAPFATAVVVPGLAAPGESVASASLSADELDIYFSRVGAEPNARAALYSAHRETRDATFGDVSKMGAPNDASNADNLSPSVSPSGRHLLFLRNDGYAFVGWFEATRTTANVDFSEVTPFGDLTTRHAASAMLLPNGRSLYWIEASMDGKTFTVNRRDANGEDAGAPAETVPVPLFSIASGVALTGDERTIYVGQTLTTTSFDGWDVYTSTRATPTSDFPKLERVAHVNEDVLDIPAWISPEGCHLYLLSVRGPSKKSQLYVASKPASPH